MTVRWYPMLQLSEVPEHHKAAWRHPSDEFQEVWRNDVYEVFVRYLHGDRFGPLHLSIKRHDREPITDWRHKQSIKNEVAGALREAFELFPAETRLVDAANQTHIWVMQDGAVIEVGFSRYAVGTKESMTEAATKLGYDPAALANAKQRGWQPGLSTGPEYAERMTGRRTT